MQAAALQLELLQSRSSTVTLKLMLAFSNDDAARFAYAHLESGLRVAEGDAIAKEGIACRRLRPPDREPLVGADQNMVQRVADAAALAGVAPDLRERRAACQRPVPQHIQSRPYGVTEGAPLEGGLPAHTVWLFAQNRTPPVVVENPKRGLRHSSDPLATYTSSEPYQHVCIFCFQ